MKTTAPNIEKSTTVKKLLDHFGMSQKEFAAQTGLTLSAVSQYYTGSRSLTSRAAHEITNRFRSVNLAWLLKGEGEMFLNRPDPQGSPIEGLGLTQLEMADIAVEARADAMRSEPDWKGEALRLERENKSKQRQIDMLLELLAEERSRK